MCSVSWQWGGGEAAQLKLIFNRDEQKSRAIATLPAIHNIDGTKSLMPLDPVGKGTWITTNEYGITIALLNKYELLPEKNKDYSSRGLVVKSLSGCGDGAEVEPLLNDILSSGTYPAFSLLVWDLNAKSEYQFYWDEKELVKMNLELPFMTSSSWNTQEVQNYRIQSFLDNIEEGKGSLNEFMRATTPEYNEWSVFMQRDLTQTVSVSEIVLDSEKTEYAYYDRNTNETSHHFLERKESIIA